MELLTKITKELLPARKEGAEHPEFKAGDTISVYYKIVELEKPKKDKKKTGDRLQRFQGVVVQRRGHGVHETFTVRKISNSIGVERIFPIHSPNIDKIVVEKWGHVRRARIFYLRDKKGAIKIKPRMFVKK